MVYCTRRNLWCNAALKRFECQKTYDLVPSYPFSSYTETRVSLNYLGTVTQTTSLRTVPFNTVSPLNRNKMNLVSENMYRDWNTEHFRASVSIVIVSAVCGTVQPLVDSSYFSSLFLKSWAWDQPANRWATSKSEKHGSEQLHQFFFFSYICC